jgi:hypothetical protein
MVEGYKGYLKASKDPTKWYILNPIVGMRPPISLPKEEEDRATMVEGQKTDDANEPTGTAQAVGELPTGGTRESTGEANMNGEDASEHPYIFQREIGTWHFRFEGEEAHFEHSDNFISLARLLNEPGRRMNALELVSEGVDIEREKVATQFQRGDKNPPHGTPDDAVDPETIKNVTKCIEEFKAEILVAQQEYDIAKVEELTEALREAQDYLDSSTRDTEKREIRRPRPLGEPGLMEPARKTVVARIERAKKIIADKKSMPRFARHLEDKVIPVRFEPQWVYIGEIHWKVKEVPTPPTP